MFELGTEKESEQIIIANNKRSDANGHQHLNAEQFTVTEHNDCQYFMFASEGCGWCKQKGNGECFLEG